MDRVLNSLDKITNRLDKLETGPTSQATPTGDQGLSAASLIANPLTKALAKLAEEDHDRGKALRPVTYSQHDQKDKSCDHAKLDTVELFYGWVCVAQHLMQTRGSSKLYEPYPLCNRNVTHTSIL